jgi:hypothetical protein
MGDGKLGDHLMFRYLLSFFIIFLFLTSFSLAKKGSDEGALQAEYGRDLTHVPYFLRYSFYNDYHLDWKKSNYAERHVFLEKYQISLAQQQIQEREDERLAKQDEREKIHAQREAERAEKDREKADLAEQRAEERENQDREKQFSTLVKEQQQEAQQIQQEQQQSSQTHN